MKLLIIVGAALIGIVLLSGRAHADNYFCNYDICISNTSYGEGLYRSTYKGDPMWIRINCSDRTISVRADGEDETASETIGQNSIASILFDMTCRAANGSMQR